MTSDDRTIAPIENYRGWAAAEDVHRLSGRKDKTFTAFVNATILQGLDVQPDHRVLDVGCGDGSLLAALNCAGRIGVVPTEEERARLVTTYDKANNLDFRVGLVQAIPADSGWADRVVCNGVINLVSSLDEARLAISELARVTKAGGLVWLGEVSGMNPEAQPSIFGSRKLGRKLHRLLSFDKGYRKFYKHEVRIIDRNRVLAVGRADVLASADAAGLDLVSDEPHRYYRNPRLIGPVRRNYLFAKRAAA